MSTPPTGAYDAGDDLVDYILGITFEIWEAGGVGLIEQYYSPETVVYALDGITHGSGEMIAGTDAMLKAFPDRLLLADDVIGTGSAQKGYSSHRVLSPMTNTGPSMFGPATGKQVRILNMADCVVENGVISLEWLARDNLALVRQLGLNAIESASLVAAKQSDELSAWFHSEAQRLSEVGQSDSSVEHANIDPQKLLHALWISGDESIVDACYAEYAVLHRSPVEIISGRTKISAHHARLRSAFQCNGATVDHVCVQAAGASGHHVATRWAVAAKHVGTYLGIAATDKPVYIMGVTHRRIVAGRIVVEWTVFDSLGVMAQLL